MTQGQQAIESAIAEVIRLRGLLHRSRAKQVAADDDRKVIKATALSWFNAHRRVIVQFLSEDQLSTLDDEYRGLIAASDKACTRKRYLEAVKRIKKALSALQSENAVPLSATNPVQQNTPDAPPDFSRLVADVAMQRILANRWSECVRCVDAGAPLAATVMMGGLLEGLLLARINQLTDKRAIIDAKSAPKDSKTGKTLNLTQWGLRDFITVASELKWISPATRDVGNVVRDYRNYVHPQKEHSHRISVSPEDAKTLWEVAKSVSRQILKI